MAGPIAIDTPDYQRGIVNAQKLLESVPAGTGAVILGVPPNAETLVVVSEANLPLSTSGVACIGRTTGIKYQSVAAPGFQGFANTWFCDVSQAVDDQVEVGLTSVSRPAWVVYVDSGVHVVVDASRLSDAYGRQYVIPSVPSTVPGDSPPVELRLVSVSLTANGTVLAAPGAGDRYRIFTAMASTAGAATNATLQDTVSSLDVLHQDVAGSVNMTYPLTGLALPANAGLTWTFFGTAARTAVLVTYTTETV